MGGVGGGAARGPGALRRFRCFGGRCPGRRGADAVSQAAGVPPAAGSWAGSGLAYEYVTVTNVPDSRRSFTRLM